jgi:hypothetical protein
MGDITSPFDRPAPTKGKIMAFPSPSASARVARGSENCSSEFEKDSEKSLPEIVLE